MVCTVCQWIYDPERGEPDQLVAVGTPWSAVPDGFLCPGCGIGKEVFEPCGRQGDGMSNEIVVIGSGFAAQQLIKCLRRLDVEQPIRLITADTGDEYNKPDLSHVVSR